jgi:hypothetical protein
VKVRNSYPGRPHGTSLIDNPASDGGLNREESAEAIVPKRTPRWGFGEGLNGHRDRSRTRKYEYAEKAENIGKPRHQ